MIRPALLVSPLLLLCASAGFAAASSYDVTGTIPVGGDGKWDYPSVDSSTHRLYLSRGTHVVVIDTATGKVAGDIPDTPGVHGIAIASDLGRGFISAGKANQVMIFDLKTLRITAKVAVGSKPDAILFEPRTRQVFAFNGHSNDVSVIDAAEDRVVATLALGGAPEFARADTEGHIFVNLENKNELAVVDVKTRRVTAHWALPGCDGPTGLALDARHHRSFSVCANSKMTILDTTDGRSIVTLPIGARVDGAEFDADGQNALSANGEGTLTVVHEADPEHFTVTQTVSTALGARTLALDDRTHKLYLPSAKFGPAAASTGEESKAPIIPGSFFVLVLERGPAP
ncbi:MAG TPA: hypothetical protein VHY75_16155 [Steroidobacteraceae bacterium]|jgi:YVTN family beta-propeller protein|nr:hypothetical protein [Steroidobacteraceae bacterium]